MFCVILKNQLCGGRPSNHRTLEEKGPHRGERAMTAAVTMSDMRCQRQIRDAEERKDVAAPIGGERRGVSERVKNDMRSYIG